MKFELPQNLEAINDGEGSDLSNGIDSHSREHLMNNDTQSELEPYENLTDDQRMEEYMHTGDPGSLSPSLAHRMGVGVDAMEGVPGHSSKDIQAAQQRDRDASRFEYESLQVVLSAYGIDQMQLQALDSNSQARRLLEVASIRLDGLSDDDEDAKEYARGVIYKRLMNHPEELAQYFNEINHEDFGLTMSCINSLDDLCEFVRLTYLQDSDEPSPEKHAAFKVICQIGNVADQILQNDPHQESNALVAIRLQVFAGAFQKKLHGWIDVDLYAPSKIAPDIYAVWNGSKDRLYINEKGDDDFAVVDAQYGDESKVGKLLRRETDTLAPYKIAMQDEGMVELEYYMHGVQDAGNELSDYLKEKVADYSDEDYEDFIVLHKQEAREGVQKFVGFDQRDLSLVEQWHLFKYLKGVSVKELDAVRSHVEAEGINGLRSFLSMEHGGLEMGDIILGISAEYDPEESKNIFEAYSHLVDLSAGTEAYLQEKFPGMDFDRELIRAIAERPLLRGMTLLKQMGENSYTPEQVAQKLKAIGGEMEIIKSIYRELLDEGAIKSLEELELYDSRVYSATHLKNTGGLDRMCEIIGEEHGENSDKGTALKAELIESLEKSNVAVRVVRLDQKIEAFCITYDTDDGDVHLGALNVSVPARDLGIGPQIIDSVLRQCALEEKDVVVEALPKQARIYSRLYGFESYGTEEFAGSTYHLMRLTVETMRERGLDTQSEVG